MISVLCVDDEFDFLDLTRAYLESLGGLTVDVVSSAAEALEKLREKSYDAIVSDYQMPVMDGIGLLMAIRGSGDLIPFIIFTGRGREEVTIQAFNEGADFYVQKSGDPVVQFADLAHKIRKSVESRRAEKALRVSEERYRTLFARMFNGFAVHEIICDDHERPIDYRFLDLNPAFSLITGLQREEVIGRTARQVIPDIEQIWIDRYGKVALTGKPDFFTEFSTDFGKYFEVAVYQNAPRQFITIFSDVTGQKVGEEEIRRSEEKFRSLLENIPDLVLVHREGKILYANPAMIATMGYRPEEVIGKYIMDYIIPEHRERAAESIRKRMNQVTSEPYELEILSKGGEHRIAVARGAVIEYGDSPAILSVLTDITDSRRAEDARREEENKYRTVFENTGTATVVLEEDETISLANAEFARLCGLSKADIEGKKKWTEFVAKDDLDWMLAQHRLRRQNREEALTNYEFHFVTSSGDIRDIFLTIDLIPATQKSVASLLDITERRQAEQAIQKAALRWQSTFDLTQDAVCTLDADQRIVMCNRMMQEIVLSGGAEDPVDRRCYEVVHGTAEPIPECPFVRMRQSLRRERLEFRRGDRWFISTTDPVLDDAEKLIGSVHNIRDITERKRAEEALRASEQRYYNIIEDQTEFICRFRPNGTYVFVNQAYADYFGTTRDALVGKIFRPRIYPGDAEKVRLFFASLTPAHPVDFIEQRIIMPGGEVRWQRWSDRAIFDTSGSIVEYQSVGRDVTAQKRTEEALRHANRQLKLLTGVTRHDILNKVSVLLGYLPLAQERSTDPKVIGYLEKLESAIKDIRDQIEFTRIYQELGGLEPQWQELREVIVRSIFSRNITISIDVENVWIFVDPMFEKVFYNLLDNSIRHGQHVTAIKVSSTESDDGLKILWEDNGIGIPQKEKRLIFERGYGKNTGLGLFLARDILSITGISITENGKPGKGARFEILVPKGKYRWS